MESSNLTFRDALDLMNASTAREEREEQDHNWSGKTALWCIVAVIVFLVIVWYIHRTGQDKAELAASVQGLYGRVNALEPAVTAQGNNLYSLNSVVSATTQAIGDFKNCSEMQIAALNGAVFTSRCGGCNNGGTRFTKRDNYTLCDSNLQAVETCG